MQETNPQAKVLGILKPMGGGDPIPLTKPEITIGRRRSCDVNLDFTNISGRHCQLRLINNVWHVRDMGSTNGTSLNGVTLASEKVVLPDDELGIASHLFSIDYEPSGPNAVRHTHEESEEADEPRRPSLLELAGIESDEDRPRHRDRPEDKPRHRDRPTAPTAGERPAARDSAFEDNIPQDFQAKPVPLADADDDDFLKFIEEDVKKSANKREDRK